MKSFALAVLSLVKISSAQSLFEQIVGIDANANLNEETDVSP